MWVCEGGGGMEIWGGKVGFDMGFRGGNEVGCIVWKGVGCIRGDMF